MLRIYITYIFKEYCSNQIGQSMPGVFALGNHFHILLGDFQSTRGITKICNHLRAGSSLY